MAQEAPKPEPTNTSSKPSETYIPIEKSPFEVKKEKWESDIKKILEKHHLFYSQDDWNTQIHGDRYMRLHVVEFDQNETDNRLLLKERFFKAPLPDPDQVKEAKHKEFFIRQIKVQDYLDERTDFPVTEVLDTNTQEAQGPMYAVMNWYQKGEGVGFLYTIEDSKELTAEHAIEAVKAIRDLSHQEEKLTPEVRAVLDKKAAFSDYIGFRANLVKILSRQVSGTEDDFSPEKHVFAALMAEKTKTPDLVQRIDQLLEQVSPVIERNQGKGEHVVHGDFAPNNIFLGDGLASDKFIGLDFEWAGISQNEVLAAAYDFGNMRARAWNNPVFQEAFDKEMIASYAREGREEEGRVIVALGTLRSSLNLASYFEHNPKNFETEAEIKLRVGTEKDLLKPFEMLKTPTSST